MDIVEVASYPKSGNTWLCNIITQYCHQQYGTKLTINGVHGKKSEIDNGQSNVRLGVNEFCIYKSHKRDHPLMQANRIIHIMRHPLDVFFSARNFLYLKAVLIDLIEMESQKQRVKYEKLLQSQKLK